MTKETTDKMRTRLGGFDVTRMQWIEARSAAELTVYLDADIPSDILFEIRRGYTFVHPSRLVDLRTAAYSEAMLQMAMARITQVGDA